MEHIGKYQGTYTSPLMSIYKLRALTAELLGVSQGQVSALTRGWSRQNIYRIYNESIKEGYEPAALWWTIYKERKYLTKKKPRQIPLWTKKNLKSTIKR